jgi:hypothetical protein
MRIWIWIRDLFDLDPGWKNSDPGSGINIQGSATLEIIT